MSTKDNDENINSQNDAEDGDEKSQDKTNGGSTADVENDDNNIDAELGDDDIDNIDDVDELKEKLKSKIEQNTKLFVRTKKAEGFIKDKTGKWVKKEKPKPAPVASQEDNKSDDNLSTMDTIALVNAKVTTKEDIETIVKYAKMEQVSISDALESDVVQTILKKRSEEKRTADATNTGSSRRGNTKQSGEALHDKANKTGELPDSDEDMAKLAESTLVPK